MRSLLTICLAALLALPLAVGQRAFAQAEPTLSDAKTELMLEKPDAALRILAEFRARHRELPIATYLLSAEAYESKGDRKAALAACQEGERHYQDSPEIAFCIAKILVETNPTLHGVEHYLKRARAQSNATYGNAASLYAHWAYETGNDALAVEKATEALPGPTSSHALVRLLALLGKAHARRGEFAKAETAFLTSLQENREFHAHYLQTQKIAATPPAGAPIRTNGIYRDFLPGPAMDYVRFLADRGRDADATYLNAEILSIHPGYVPALLYAARDFAQRGQLNDAARTAESALAGAPRSEAEEAEARRLLSDVYTRMGQPEKAARVRNGPHA